MTPEILVMDDDPQMRRLLQMTLERNGYQVRVAADGVEGLGLFRQRPAELVIADVLMPEKDGIEIMDELRREFPLVKIIAMSGGGKVASTDYLKIAEALGAHRTFDKPFEPAELLAAVQELLEQ